MKKTKQIMKENNIKKKKYKPANNKLKTLFKMMIKIQKLLTKKKKF